MIRLLVSVRSVDEALQVAAAGADFIDLKEPRSGALGALAPAQIAAIVAAVRARHPRTPVSATTGDFDDGEGDAVVAAAEVVARCGVDYVKVGIVRSSSAVSLLCRLAETRLPVVPVLLCDDGLDEAAMHAACDGPFPAVMVDTRNKRSASLFDCIETSTVATMIAVARASGKLAGVAGALRERHVATLVALAPDFAGFRGAVCSGDRTGDVDPRKVRELGRALRDAIQIA